MSTQAEIAQREAPTVTKRIKFTGGLGFNESHQMYRQIDPNILDYVGFPTPEIDAAWAEITEST